MKLNKTNAAQVEVPPDKHELIIFDDDIAGFGLRARAGGSRNWVFQYRQGGKQRRISFGSASTVSAQQARERAVQLHAQVKLGHDPAGQKIETQREPPRRLGRCCARTWRAIKPRCARAATTRLSSICLSTPSRFMVCR